MDNAEYTQTQQQLLALAEIVRDLPLEEFLDKIGMCEAVAPLINPTLYIEAADKLQFIKDIARAAKTMQSEVLKAREALKEHKD